MEPLRIRDALRIVALLVVLGHPRLAGAAASKASDLCPVTADPCVVTADVTVDPDTVLDFGGRALDLRPGSSLSFASGTLTIRARSVRVEPAASILGSAPISSFPTLSIVTTGDIRVEASGTTKGKIDVSGSAQGGIITLAALGAMQVDGNLLAKISMRTANRPGRRSISSVSASGDRAPAARARRTCRTAAIP